MAYGELSVVGAGFISDDGGVLNRTGFYTRGCGVVLVSSESGWSLETEGSPVVETLRALETEGQRARYGLGSQEV